MSITSIHRIAVLTIAWPEYDRPALGVVAAQSDVNLSFAESVEQLRTRLMLRAQELFPEARQLCNLAREREYDDDGHPFYVGTADAYGEIEQ